MAVGTLKLATPTHYRGLEDLVPNEMSEFTVELIRRLEANRTSLFNDLTSQVITDASILPPQTSGDSTPFPTNIATMDDVEGTEFETLMFGGF